jgi:hypothetical protein
MSSDGPFSPEFRLESIRRQFKPGQIFYLFCEFTRPKPKPKFVLLVCVEPRPLVFLINTKKSGLILSDPDLENTQVCLTPSEYRCLDHDSYIDCLEVFEMDQEEIERQILADSNNSRIKDRLSRKCIAELINAVSESSPLMGRDRNWILNALRSVRDL